MKCALVKPIPGSQIQDGWSTKKKNKGHLLTYLCTNKSCHKEYQSNDLVRVLTRKITPLAGNIKGLSIIIYLQVYLVLILNIEKKPTKTEHSESPVSKNCPTFTTFVTSIYRQKKSNMENNK